MRSANFDSFRVAQNQLLKCFEYILDPGILDDLIERLLISIVSVWLTSYFGMATPVHLPQLIGLILLFFLAIWVSYRWLIPFFGRRIDPKSYVTLIYCITLLLLFSSFAKISNLGLVVGALAAGIAIRPWIIYLGEATSTKLIETVEMIAYGFARVFFFFETGLLVQIEALFTTPWLTILLFLSTTLGKLGASFLMVPSKVLTKREAVIVGIGLDVQMTTELVVAILKPLQQLVLGNARAVEIYRSQTT